MVCWSSSSSQFYRSVAADSEGSIPGPAALSNEVLECHLVQRWVDRRIHQQLLILPLEESYCCLCSIRPGSSPACWHRLNTMCLPESHPGRCEEGHVCYYPLRLARVNVHPFSEQILSDRLSAFLLSCSPQNPPDQEELMLLCHVLDLTVVHEHDIAKLFCPDSREAGSRTSWLCLLAYLTVLDYTVIKTIDALWQVQLV